MTIEQKATTIANNDTDLNAEITAQNADGFLVVSLTISGTDVIILSQKVTTAS